MDNFKPRVALLKTGCCKDCGWMIIQIDVGEKHYQDIEQYKSHTYWGYCSNKLCENHDGENWDEKCPSFVRSLL